MEIIVQPLGPLQTNCYVLSLPGREECVVIDPGDDPAWLAALAARRPVAAALLTHAHFDHILGLPALGDVPVYVHRLDAAAMTDPRLCLAPAGRALKAPTHLVEEGDRFTAAGIAFAVLHTPGHTPGSCCYAVGEDLFTGDTLFAQGYGRTDLPGGNFGALRQSLVRLLRLEGNPHLWPGHGEDCFLNAVRGGGL